MQGNHIGHIRAVGRAANEYINLMDFFVDRESKQIVLYADPSKFLFYDYNLKPTRVMKAPALFYETVNSAEVIIPDGIGVIKAAKILGTPLRERIPGVELGERIIRESAGHGAKIFFLGSKPGVAETAAEVMKERYPSIDICGCRDGYFKKEGSECDEVVGEINESAADILFVCLGAPVQEKWICANRARLPGVRVFLALGGSLDSYSGNVKRAPEFFCRHGLEWFYRLMCQPSRIGRMMKLPKFYFGTWMYKLSGKNKN